MTDTRLPEHFLTNPILDRLTADAFRVYVNGLMWSVSQGTDGLLPERALRYLHPDGKRLELSAELTAAGLWEHDDAGYRVPDFLKYQTPAEQIERSRAFTRERKRRQRERELADDRERDDPRVSRVTGRVTGRVTSEDRTGEAGSEDNHYESLVGDETEGEQQPVPAAEVRCYACKTINPLGAAECSWCHNRINVDGSSRLKAVGG